MSNKIRILLVDDQKLFAENLKTVIETRTEDMNIVGIANDGDQAVLMTKSLQPDVILMDVCMPYLDGVKAIREIRTFTSRPKILVLTTFGDDDYVLEAIKFGASGYLLKDISMIELIQTIRGLSSETITISPSVADSLVKTIEQGKETNVHTKIQETPPQKAPKWIDLLNKRERQILVLVAQGLNNYYIGSSLGISEQTVKNYVSGIYDKSGIHDRYLIIKETENILSILEDA